MTETINRSSVAGRFVLKSSKVADAPKKILDNMYVCKKILI